MTDVTSVNGCEINAVEKKEKLDGNLLHYLDYLFESSNFDENQVYSYLLWSRLCCTSSLIMTRLINTQWNFVSELVAKWIVWFPEDFVDEASMQKVKKLLQNSVKTQPRLLSTLTSHLAAIKKHKTFLEKAKERKSNSPLPVFMELKTVSLAQELTRIEMEYLSYLGPSEFINVIAKEKVNSKGQNPETREAMARAALKTRNYDAYTQWFNHMSFLVASTICKVSLKLYVFLILS